MNTLKERYIEIGTGWSRLLDMVDEVLLYLGDKCIVTSVTRHNGMLRIEFANTTNTGQDHIQDAIAYRIERMSAKLCENCGRYGLRRTELPTIQTLCTSCYAIKYSEMVDQTS